MNESMAKPSSARAMRHEPPQIRDHELIRKIGGGSYGEVWLARTVIGTYRAVKIVFRQEEDARAFDREFKGLQKFEPISRAHEGFVDILQIGRNETAGFFYYVMELADDANVGQASSLPVADLPCVASETGKMRVLLSPAAYLPLTLGRAIKRRGALPVSQCVEIGLSLVRALDHLHNHGLVHRDIKPSNIIFVKGVAKLADIGLVTGTDATRTYVGTEGFIPPEGPGTPQADLYSLGKVLYEASTGKDRHDFPELPTAMRESPDRVRLVELNEVLLKACAPDLRYRYRTAEELDGDLKLLHRGESVRRKRTRDRRLVAAKYTALATIGIVLLCLAGVIGERLISGGKGQQSALPRATSAKREQAQQLYHKALLDGGHLTKQRFTDSIEYLNQALELDAAFPSAYEALAGLYRQASEWHLPPKQAMSEAKKNIRQALALNNDSARAHLTLAWIHMHHDWDWMAAEREFRHALTLAPTDPMTHCDLAWYLRMRGRLEEAAAFQEKAQALGQSNFPVNVATAWQYCLEQRYEEVEKACRDLKRLHAGKEVLHIWLARIYERLGRYQEAEAHLQALRAVDDAPDVMAFLGHLYGIMGRQAEAIALLNELETIRRSRYVSHYFSALILAGLGVKSRALDELDRALEARSANLTDLRMDPRWDSFRTDERFQKILTKVGLN